MKIDSNFPVSSQAKIKQSVKKTGADSLEGLATKDMVVSYYPQDPCVGKPVLSKISGEGITPGPTNARIETDGDVKPNAEGNLVFAPEDPAFINVQTFTTVEKTLNIMQRHLGRKINWAFGGEQITVIPDKGEMKNAYYSRGEHSLNFFHFKSKTGETVNTGKSFDVSSHETGHAILDGVKPRWLGGWNKETQGIHEAFGDMTAMIAALDDETNIDMFLKETNGDFRKPNVIANLGEQFGQAVYGRPYLRNAINDYTYSPPDSLPDHPAPGQLGGEAHSFAQLFVGTFYDIMEGLFHAAEAEGLSKRDALIKMRDTAGKLLMKGVDCSPPSSASYKDLALGMIKADQLENGGKYKDIMMEVFKKRKIMTDRDAEGVNRVPEKVFLNSSNSDGVVDFVDKNREKFGIADGIPLELARVHRNDDGSEIFDVTYTKEVTLKGDDYGIFSGAVVDIDAGVSLSTKSNGELCSMAHSTLRAEDTENIKNNMKDYIKDGLIKYVDPSDVGKLKDEDFFDKKGRLYMGYTTYEDGKMKIVKTPIVE